MNSAIISERSGTFDETKFVSTTFHIMTIKNGLAEVHDAMINICYTLKCATMTYQSTYGEQHIHFFFFLVGLQ